MGLGFRRPHRPGLRPSQNFLLPQPDSELPEGSRDLALRLIPTQGTVPGAGKVVTGTECTHAGTGARLAGAPSLLDGQTGR